MQFINLLVSTVYEYIFQYERFNNSIWYTLIRIRVVKCRFGFLVNEFVFMDSYDGKRENLNTSRIDIYQKKRNIFQKKQNSSRFYSKYGTSR